MQTNRYGPVRLTLLAGLLSVGASCLTSCGRRQAPPEVPHLPPKVAQRPILLPRDDVLTSIELKQGPPLQSVTSPWKQEQSRLFTDVLSADPVDVLVVPFEVQDRGFDRIERALMSADFASAISQRLHLRVANSFLAARALGEGQRRYQDLDVRHLANVVKARILIRGYVGHDGHGRMALTLTVQQRDSADDSWTQHREIHRDWTELPFSDEDLPYKVVHGLQAQMLSLVTLSPAPVPARNTNAVTPWPLPQLPFDLGMPPVEAPASPAAQFAVLAAVSPGIPELPRERLAERGLLLLDQNAGESPDLKFLRSYFLHLLHRRPAALAALGQPQSPGDTGLQAVLNGNLDTLETTIGHAAPLEALLLEFELCDLKLEYGGACDRAKLARAGRLARVSKAWGVLVASRLTDLSAWDVQSNAQVKSLLDDTFPIPNFSLPDLVRAAVVIGNDPSGAATIDLSTDQHVRRILGSDPSLTDSGSAVPDRLDYLQLLEGIGESNLLKAVARKAFMQGLAADSLQQLRAYEIIYAGHPAFAELHARLLRSILSATPDQPSVAVTQEFEQQRFAAAYGEQGENLVSARAFAGGNPSPSLDMLNEAYTEDFPIRAWWPAADAVNSPAQVSAYVDSRDRHTVTLDELSYAETEIPSFVIEQPFLPLTDLRKLLEQRFRGSPAAAEILARVAGPQSGQTDPGAAYRQAIAQNPAVWSNYSNLGDWQLQNGNPAAAARAYLSYPGFWNQRTDPTTVVANSNYAYEAGSALYWRGALEPALKLFQIAANDDDGSYASISSAGRLAMSRGDVLGYLKASVEAAQRYSSPSSYRDYLSMLHALGSHQAAWAGFNGLAERFEQPEVWVSAFVGQRMAATTPDQLTQWLLGGQIRHAHFLGRSFSADYAILWNSIDREPPSNLPQLLDDLQGPSRATIDDDGLSTIRPSWRQEGSFDLLMPSQFRRTLRKRSAVGSTVPWERTLFADAYVELRHGHYAEAVQKFDALAAHYPLDTPDERYVIPYFAYASAKAGDPLHFEDYLRSAQVGGDFAAFLAAAFFDGLHGHKAQALEDLKAAFYNRPLENTDPIFSEYRYAEACEWLFRDTHEEVYRQRALEWARMQQRVSPQLSWAYALEARLLAPGPERTRALAMTLYLDPLSKVVDSLSVKERSDLNQWLDRNNPFTHQRSAPNPALRQTAI